MPKLAEKTSFRSDKCQTSIEKNERLAELLEGYWGDFAIVKIDRIEIGKKGWRVTYRG